MPYTTLAQQPDWWVERTVMWVTAKRQAERVQAEEEQRRSKRRR